MKTFLAALIQLCRRLRFVLLGVALVVLLALGGAYGWKTYKYRHSPDFALENLRKALQPPKPEALAKLVDFRALSLDLARNIYAERPETPRQGNSEEESIALMAETIQRSLLEALENARNPDNAKKPVAANAPLSPVPATLIAQLGNGLAMQSFKDGVALARAEVEYPRAERDFTVVLLLEERPGRGWTVTRIANAGELARQFAGAEQSLQRQRDEAFAEKNQAEQRRMNAQLRITSCTAAARLLADKTTALLSMEILGHNVGKEAIANLNLRVSITGKGAELQKQLNMAQRINPGENFAYTWNADISENTPENEALLRAGALQCAAEPHAMTLHTGVLLYIREKPPTRGGH